MNASGPIWRVRRPPKVVEQDAFASLLDLELEKANRLAYCVSVVSMALEQLEHGPHASLASLAANVAAHVRSTDLVAVIPPRFLALLLVDAPAKSLTSIIARLSSETGLSDTAAGWSAGGSSY